MTTQRCKPPLRRKRKHSVENCGVVHVWENHWESQITFTVQVISWLFAHYVSIKMGVAQRKEWAGSSRKVWFFWQQHQLTFQTAELAHKKKNIAYIFENSELWRYKHYITSHEFKHTLELHLKHTWRKAHAWKFQLPMKQSWPKPLNTHYTI